MSNEKMREEFEVWSANHEYLGGTGLFMVDDRYKDIDVQHAWESWRDSRAAIEVELPKTVGFEGAYDSLRSHEFCPSMEDLGDADEIYGLCRAIEVRETLESLGLKVNP